MKILHTVYTIDPEVGGSFEAVRQFSLAHMEMGHEVEILSLDTPDKPYLRDFPIPVYPLGVSRGKIGFNPKSLPWHWRKYGYTPKLVPWLRENRHRYDAVIINGIYQYNSFGAWRVLRNSDTPYFVYTHGYLDPWFKRAYRLKHLKKWLYWPWADYRVVRDATATLFTCQSELERSYETFWLYNCRPRIATLGIHRPEGDPGAQREIFLNAYPDLRGKPFLLFLSRIHKKKGVEHLMDAFGEVARDEKDLRLVMAGPGDQGYVDYVRSRLEPYGKEIASRVIWTGMIEGDLKWGAFRAADAFILPSHTENFGIATVEALACGTPALISREINIWKEMVEDDAAWAESDDKEGTVRMIRRWLDLSPSERGAMGRRALDCYNTRFEIHRAAQHLIDVLQEEISRPAQPAGRG